MTPGEKLGPYEILAPNWGGGMGEVYRARDTRLDRTVAIKVCREQFTEGFEGEARAIAALRGRRWRVHCRWRRHCPSRNRSAKRWRRRTRKGSGIGI